MPDEVIVVAIATLREGDAPKAEDLFRSLISATHAEDGCITFALHRDVSDPRRFALVERWSSREALDRHLLSDHVAEFVGSVAEIRDAPTQVLVLEPVPAGDPAKGVL